MKVLLIFIALALGPAVAFGQMPTISDSGTSATVTGSLVAMTDSRFTYLGATMATAGVSYPDNTLYAPTGLSSTNGALPFQVEFATDAANFELYFKTPSASGYFRVWIDGTLVSSSVTSAGGSAGALRYYKVACGSRAIRTVHVETSGFMYFGGVQIGTNDSLFKAQRPRRKKCIIVGDSFTEGTGASNRFLDFASWLANLTGWEVWQSGSGGTGYLATGPFSRVKYRDRVTNDVINQSPDVVIVTGGQNDQAYTSNQIQTEAGLLYDAITAGLPNARLIVVAPFAIGTPATSGLLTVRTGVLAAANARSLSVIDPLVTNSEWVTGSYASCASGNACVITSGDGTHPTDAGHEYLAKRIYAEIVRLGLN